MPDILFEWILKMLPSTFMAVRVGLWILDGNIALGIKRMGASVIFNLNSLAIKSTSISNPQPSITESEKIENVLSRSNQI